MSKFIWQPTVVLPVVVGGMFVSRILPEFVPTSTAKLVLAMVILPAILYLIFAQARWIRDADELQHRIMLQTYSCILAGVLALTFTLHSLHKAGFAMRLDVIDGLVLGGGIGAVVAWVSTRRRYGSVNIN
jgi:hypothetical protein